MVSKSIYTEVEVDVDMSDFSDEELLAELEDRGLTTAAKVDINRLEHLIDCGCIEYAQRESWQMILRHIQTKN